MSEPPLSVQLGEERAARRAAELERDQLAFLASAGTALLATLDPVGTVGTLARLLVPALCDWCTVHTVADGGHLAEAATAHATEAGVGLLEASRRAIEAAGRPVPWGAPDVARTGETRRIEPVDDRALRTEAVDRAHLDVLRRLGSSSILVLPLFARGRVIAVLTVGRTEPTVTFEPDLVSLIENVATRAGMALDNARLFVERTQVARILQQALLPPSLPEIPGVEVSARYRTAERQLDIGGDFYDVFEQPDGSWSMVIGDVSGKGSVAAAVTGLVRNTIRAVSQVGSSPSQVLRRTNEVLLDQVEETRFCTAALMHLHPAARPEDAGGAGTVGAEVELSSGGHPRPFLVRTDGDVDAIDCAGTLLGALPGPDLADVSLRLAPGDAIVLYTDGVTEARRGNDEFGEAGIAEVLHTCIGRSAGTIADELARAVHTFADDGAGDDTAVLVVRLAPPG